jgi:bifunctional non-homologous end joining protein LigD
MADPLSTYREKRDFRQTPEPEGKVKRAKGRLFIVQKHDATRLHYDFRLELDGVLLSWAVTRGPSMNPADKRLAVRVEDHPVAYGGFEGVIPSGYGAGTVMLWDRGSWAPQEDPQEGLRKGSLKIVLNGERLKGGFALVRMKPRPGEGGRHENWLLIKERDDWADETVVATEAWTTSVKSGRSLDRIEREGERYSRGKTYRAEGRTTPRKAVEKTVRKAVGKAAAREAAKAAASEAAAPEAVKTRPRARTSSRAAPKAAPKSRTRGKAKPRPRTQAERVRPSRALSRPIRQTATHALPRRAPTFIAPQLATLVDAPPPGPNWLHEIKFDGYRIIAVIHRGRARLFTRNQLDWTERYRRIATEVEALGLGEAVLDGELVALDDKGAAAFSRMQQAGEDPSIPLIYYLFDLLNLEGEDLTRLPLVERKARLAAILKQAPGQTAADIRYSDHIVGDGGQVIASACNLKLEGVVSKQADAPYRSGRVGSWVKSKCIGNDEFVIGGYRKSDKPGRPFSSLLLGEHEGGRLVYRGRVGTGFDEAGMADLAAKFARRRRPASPFESVPAEARGAVWLKPDLVAQIAYLEVTPDGRLRHPSYLGLREDKPASEVVRGRQKAAAEMKPTRTGGRAARQAAKAKSAGKSVARLAAEPGAQAPAKARAAGRKTAPSAAAKAGGDGEVEGVRISHPERVLWPEVNVTKLQLAEYYSRAANRILPFLKDRPLSLVRCPDGRTGACFFQKHHNPSTPDELETVDIAEKDGGHAAYLVVRSKKGLIAAAQVSGMELHVWGARTDNLEKPERIVFDLDPDQGLSFADVREAAIEVRDVLKSAGLDSFAMLTGGKGVHVIAPLGRRNAWPEVKAFARGFAEAMAKAAPDRYVAQASKARRTGKIFIDWLRNERGATAVAPYTLRARENATVATPVSWAELKKTDSAARFTLANIAPRLAASSDPWPGYFETRQTLSQKLRETFG